MFCPHCGRTFESIILPRSRYTPFFRVTRLFYIKSVGLSGRWSTGGFPSKRKVRENSSEFIFGPAFSLLMLFAHMGLRAWWLRSPCCIGPRESSPQTCREGAATFRTDLYLSGDHVLYARAGGRGRPAHGDGARDHGGRGAEWASAFLAIVISYLPTMYGAFFLSGN